MWAQQLANSHNDEQAALRYQDALQYRPDDVEVHVRLGMTFARMERLNESQSEFEAVLRLKPDSQLAREAHRLAIFRGMHSGEVLAKWLREHLRAKGKTRFGDLRDPASIDAAAAARVRERAGCLAQEHSQSPPRRATSPSAPRSLPESR